MLAKPTRVDPEIAAAVLQQHLSDLWNSGRPIELGWGLIHLDPLHSVTALPASRPDGTREWYFVKLGGEYYDSAPPTVCFVDPSNWAEAAKETRWLPNIQWPTWFRIHPAYSFPGENTPRQLVCFSFTAEYYMVNHSPHQSELWQQGRHTVAATLNRLAEVLRPPHYLGPAK